MNEKTKKLYEYSLKNIPLRHSSDNKNITRSRENIYKILGFQGDKLGKNPKKKKTKIQLRNLKIKRVGKQKN